MLSQRWGLIGLQELFLVVLAAADYDTVGKHVDNPVRVPSVLICTGRATCGIATLLAQLLTSSSAVSRLLRRRCCVPVH